MSPKVTTTVIGSYPRPPFVQIPDWFNVGLTTSYTTKVTDDYLKNMPADHEYQVLRAVQDILQDQDELGIDVITDGEVRRGNYVHYHCRHLKGISFDKLTKKVSRNGAYKFMAPTVVAKIEPTLPFLANEWKINSLFTDKPAKVTLPGPMTIADTVANEHYEDEQQLYDDIVKALNFEIIDLAKNGCVHIQIDEPILVRKPEDALAFGIKNLERCFAGVPKHVVKTIHACCGYPDKLDSTDYPKADKDAYLQVADALDKASIDAVSLEDTHRRNNLELFSKFKNTTVILGVLGIAESRVETAEEIKKHIQDVLKKIPSQRLVVAPDCGLGMLPNEICKKKLKNMVDAVTSINKDLNT